MSAPIKVIRFSRNILTGGSWRSIILRCGCRHKSNVAAVTPKTWQLHSAVCLQRYPRVSAQPNELEEKYAKFMKLSEDHESYLSNYEMEGIEEKKRLAKQVGMTAEEKQKMDEKSLHTQQEMQDLRQKEMDAFKLGDVVTDADRNNDEHTHYQKLDKKLVLIVKQKFPGETEQSWSFPQSQRVDGESMREAAERTLMTKCGESVDDLFVGNAPCGYHKYKLPISCKDSEYGVKLFFFKANHSSGEIEHTDHIIDHKWVTFDDLPNYLGEKYNKSVQKFLLWT